MDLPEFIDALPQLDLPVPGDVVSTRAIRSDNGLMVFFIFHEDFDLPAHSHLGQWGTVVAGEVHLTVEGETTVYRPGESYNIPTGAEHSAHVPKGTIALDIFEEPDRYPLKA